MAIVTGVLPNVVKKLGELLIGEYNLQKGVKGEIRFLQSELESMQGALEKVSSTPIDQLDIQDKIWAKDLRELSYDIEDSIDTFMVQGEGNEKAKLHGIKKFIDRSVGLFRKAKIRHGIATEIKDIKSRVKEVAKRHDRYKINNDIPMPVTVDPRLFTQYQKVKDLVGIDDRRDELSNIMKLEDNNDSKKIGKVLSIFGFGGLGKTTLAKALYDELRHKFDCCAFVSVSQTPDFKKLFKGMLYDLGTNINGETFDEWWLINKLSEFLEKKRYIVIIDDIWKVKDWTMIRCALPDNDSGYRIITTTRSFDVAEHVGGPYKMEPLSLLDSRVLLHSRIFSCGVLHSRKFATEDNDIDLDEELVKIFNRILEKCAGVPLVIITIGSLLASKGRHKMEWNNVYNSIGAGLQKNILGMEDIRKVVALSYYDMPSNLKTCLLYLSVFPEDYAIQKGHLIRLWIAEGFIQSKNNEEISLFELGEWYLNELINKSMIQPLYDEAGSLLDYCHVHDVVLDLIRYISIEENFVTLPNCVDCIPPSKRIRRLSLQNCRVDHTTHWDVISMHQVRSVIGFPSASHLMPGFSSFKVLRVLDLEDFDLSQGCNIKYLGNLFHLRYLGLNHTCIDRLPEEIGNLRFLQTLDVRYNEISCLPQSLVSLRDLMFLYVHHNTRVPNGIGSLTSLEELSMLCIESTDDDTMGIIEELGHLRKLRVLDIVCLTEQNNILEKSLVESLCKLQKLQSLGISFLSIVPNRSMELMTGALPTVICNLGDLLIGDYNLQNVVKRDIRYLRADLVVMLCALEKLLNTPINQLHYQNKIWARDLRELSYDIEDSINTFIVCHKGSNKLKELHGIKKFIDRSINLSRKAKIRREMATEIRELKCFIEGLSNHRNMDRLPSYADRPITVDRRLLVAGIDHKRDKLIKYLAEGDKISMQQGKIVSIYGLGGLGKTTLAHAVYKKIRTHFDCCAFIYVSRTPDVKKIFKGLLYDLGQSINEETLDEMQLIEVLREFLQDKRYFVVLDDIWYMSDWEMIRCALPDNDVGYTILTTTRISEIAKRVGDAYTMKPLSLNNSRTLLCRRIFGNENEDNNEDIEKCPNKQLAEVSNEILKKCAGVPLAIITMASLLAFKGRNNMEWYEVYNSIGIENDLGVGNTRKILSFSYHELPCHLRPCLLYLSMFLEDFEIGKDRLIRMWIGEGFIRCEKPGKSLFELGESYFNELINRSMIQPIHSNLGDKIQGCRIHDMVLDLICCLSSEENFVTVLNDSDHISPSNVIRRLSLQNGKRSHLVARATCSLQHARSVVVFPSPVVLVPSLGTCRVLRVLDLEDCNLSQANNLKYLGNLHYLRYLGLRGTCISQLPEEVGNLQFLQTLDASHNQICSLPSSVVQLQNLMYLFIDQSIRVPNGIGNLTCLEQLSWLGIDGSTLNIIEDLGHLTELRLLHIELDEWNGKLLECLFKLQKIQELHIRVRSGQLSIGGLDSWVAPGHLRALCTLHSCWFSTLPAWVNPSLLLDLTHLSIAVRELHKTDLQILGRLPALCSLDLEVDNKNLGIVQTFVVGAGLFPCLVACSLRCFVLWTVVFEQGVMPRLREIRFLSSYVMRASGVASSGGGLDLGLGNLPSLQDFRAVLVAEGGVNKEEAEQAKAALMHEAEMHPNHPRHEILFRRDDE